MSELTFYIYFVVAQLNPETMWICQRVRHMTRSLHVCEQMSSYHGGGVNCDARDREQGWIDTCGYFRNMQQSR